MPEVTAAFKHIEDLQPHELQDRYSTLCSRLTLIPNSNLPDPNAPQDDAVLQEMCVILQIMRKRSAGPPKRKASGSTPRQKAPEFIPSLDML